VPSLARLHRVVLAAAAATALAATAAHAQVAVAGPAGPFGQLGGSWSGGGQARFADGTSERLRCRAYYSPKAGGNELGLALRCASTSTKMEIRAQLVNQKGRVTGTWEERTFNAAGRATGRVSSGNLSVAIVGGGLTGTMSVSFGGSSQRVSITTSGLSLKGVSISLSRG
jgi:hypothetical protein